MVYVQRHSSSSSERESLHVAFLLCCKSETG
ncbi:hypothetical protein JMJ77_0012117, partial [Colletotrichum scovillei]